MSLRSIQGETCGFLESLTWFFGSRDHFLMPGLQKDPEYSESDTGSLEANTSTLQRLDKLCSIPRKWMSRFRLGSNRRLRSSRCVELEIIGCVGFFEISWHCWNHPRSSLQSKANWRTNQWDFQGPPIVGMVWELVWEAYHKGVPLLGAPGITLEQIVFFPLNCLQSW